MDIRVVKSFYRGTPWGKLALPNLLVHDDGFLSIERTPTEKEPKALKNVVKGKFEDTADLRAVNIERNRQFWLTIHVPENAGAGTYRTTLRIQPRGSDATELQFQLDVYPFRLDPPMLEYSVYYPTNLLAGGETPSKFIDVGANQYRLELHDMMSHGLANPNIYWVVKTRQDGTIDFTNLEQVLKLREEAGMKPGTLYLVEHPLPFSDQPLTSDQRKAFERYVPEINNWARSRGYNQVLFMAGDEWWGDRRARERESMMAVHEAGGQVFTAVLHPGFVDDVGDVLDGPVLYSLLPQFLQEAIKQYEPGNAEHHVAEIARKSIDRFLHNERFRNAVDSVHSAGFKIFTYMNPPAGIPLPDLQRRSEGLGLWRAGLDGIMTWAYTHNIQTKIEPLEQDLSWAFVMRTGNGVLDTLQWEGFREGVDDMRYLSTPLSCLNRATGRYSDDPVIRQTSDWLKRIDVVNADLDSLRREMANRIIALQTIGAPGGASKQPLSSIDRQQIKNITFPEPWRFRMDHMDERIKQKWFDPSVDDHSWAEVRTDKGFGWEKQGFGDPAAGIGWYRTVLPTAQEARRKSKFAYLYFGAVDEDAWIYLNGQKIAEHTVQSTGMLPEEIWLTPFVVPLTGVKLHGRDVLAVRVLNRTSMGGIWKPVKLLLSDRQLSNEQIYALAKESRDVK